MQVIILSTALLLAGASMADASKYSKKHTKYEVDCGECQGKAAHYWKEASEKHDYKCDKIEHIYKKTLSFAPKGECKTKYGSYVKWHYNQFDEECDDYKYDDEEDYDDEEKYDYIEEEKDCKYYQKEAAKYWEDSADEYDYKCEKLEHIYKKALSYAPENECKTKYGSYIEWHYNQLDKKCDDEKDCKKYQKEAEQYWNKSAKHHHYKCEKLEHIYKKALSYAPENQCKTKYASYVKWHYNKLDKKCDW